MIFEMITSGRSGFSELLTWGACQGFLSCRLVGTAEVIELPVLGAWPGFTSDSVNELAVSGDYAYLAAGSLQVIDIRNPEAMTRVYAPGFSMHHDARSVAVDGSLNALRRLNVTNSPT